MVCFGRKRTWCAVFFDLRFVKKRNSIVVRYIPVGGRRCVHMRTLDFWHRIYKVLVHMCSINDALTIT